MLTKNVDQVVIGKSTFSVLLGLQLLHSGSNVLLLDDDRIGYGELYERFLGETTLWSLNSWGEDLDAKPLLNISSYAKPISHTYHLEAYGHSKRVKLGHSPLGNMIELSRKLGYPVHQNLLPTNTSFDEEVLASLKRLGRHLYKFQSLSQLDVKTITAQLPRELVEWAEVIVSPYFGRKQLDLNKPWDAFFYVARAIFHQKFSLDFSAAEIWHLLLEAVSPRYEVDSNKLVDDLVAIYQLRGGQFKSTRVREWMFYKASPWSLELSSYEGIIHPKKLVLMGSHTSPIGLELDPHDHSYISVLMDFEPELGSGYDLSDEIHFFFSPKDVGTDFGLWSVRQKKSKRLEVQVALRQREGMKIEFLHSQLLARAQNLLDLHFPLLKAISADEVMKQGREIWIDEHFHKPRRLRGELLLPANISLRQVLSPGRTEKVKNVSYFGPGKRDRLGLISSLLDMKDALPRLQ